MITSSNNIQIKNLIKLQKSSKERKKQKKFVVEGKKMCEEASSLELVEKLYISETIWNETKNGTFQDIPYEVVSDPILKEVSDTMTPQGSMAIVHMPMHQKKAIFSVEKGSFLFLENVRDPGNLGTMIRTAEGAGITGVIISKESVDIYNPKVIRSTMGSIYRVPFVYVEDFEAILKEAKENGITLYATDLQGKKDYDQENYRTKCGIIIGNEANGITQETREITDFLIKIPMCGSVESLNAGVAAAIMMYEIYRQKRNL